MVSLGLGTAIGLTGLSALGTMGTTAGQMIYNKKEAQRNRDFQEHMRDTSLKSIVNQATELGISPSLVLNQGNSSLGGSQASVSGNKSPMATGVGQFIDYLKHENQLKTMEEMNEDRIQSQNYIAHEKNEALKERQEMINENIRKMSNSVNSFQARKYKEKDFENLYDDISKIKI